MTERERFFALAARIFGVEPSALDDNTSRDTLDAWDSVNHIRLVIEAERLFSVRLALGDIPGVSTLGGLFRLLNVAGEPKLRGMKPDRGMR